MDVYTDGSKLQNDVGSACIIMKNETIETIIVRKLPQRASVQELNIVQFTLTAKVQ